MLTTLFLFNEPATPDTYTLSLHDALPIWFCQFRLNDVIARWPRVSASGPCPKHGRSEEHTSELQSQFHLVCRLLLEKKQLPKKQFRIRIIRNFGMKILTMTNLSTECLIQL